MRLTKHFDTKEFECKCGKLGRLPSDGFCNGAIQISSSIKLAASLQVLRYALKVPLIIESGGRCWEYHKYLYAESAKHPPKNSAHLYWLGADVWPTDLVIEETDHNRKMLYECGFRGVGWRLGQLKNKIHLDIMDRGKPEGVLAEWSYA